MLLYFIFFVLFSAHSCCCKSTPKDPQDRLQIGEKKHLPDQHPDLLSSTQIPETHSKNDLNQQLLAAMAEQNWNKCLVYLQQGADSATPNAEGRTVLHLLIINQVFDIARTILREYKTEPDAQEEREKALDYALESSDSPERNDIVQQLADLNEKYCMKEPCIDKKIICKKCNQSVSKLENNVAQCSNCYKSFCHKCIDEYSNENEACPCGKKVKCPICLDLKTGVLICPVGKHNMCCKACRPHITDCPICRHHLPIIYTPFY